MAEYYYDTQFTVDKTGKRFIRGRDDLRSPTLYLITDDDGNFLLEPQELTSDDEDELYKAQQDKRDNFQLKGAYSYEKSPLIRIDNSGHTFYEMPTPGAALPYVLMYTDKDGKVLAEPQQLVAGDADLYSEAKKKLNQGQPPTDYVLDESLAYSYNLTPSDVQPTNFQLPNPGQAQTPAPPAPASVSAPSAQQKPRKRSSRKEELNFGENPLTQFLPQVRGRTSRRGKRQLEYIQGQMGDLPDPSEDIQSTQPLSGSGQTPFMTDEDLYGERDTTPEVVERLTPMEELQVVQALNDGFIQDDQGNKFELRDNDLGSMDLYLIENKRGRKKDNKIAEEKFDEAITNLYSYNHPLYEQRIQQSPATPEPAQPSVTPAVDQPLTPSPTPPAGTETTAPAPTPIVDTTAENRKNLGVALERAAKTGQVASYAAPIGVAAILGGLDLAYQLGKKTTADKAVAEEIEAYQEDLEKGTTGLTGKEQAQIASGATRAAAGLARDIKLTEEQMAAATGGITSAADLERARERQEEVLTGAATQGQLAAMEANRAQELMRQQRFEQALAYQDAREKQKSAAVSKFAGELANTIGFIAAAQPAKTGEDVINRIYREANLSNKILDPRAADRIRKQLNSPFLSEARIASILRSEGIEASPELTDYILNQKTFQRNKIG